MVAKLQKTGSIRTCGPALCRATSLQGAGWSMEQTGSNRYERKLVALFAADVAGFSRQVEADEIGTLHALEVHRAVMDRLIAEHGGRIANTAGDSVLGEFPSAERGRMRCGGPAASRV